MQFAALIEGIDLELFAYWVDRDLRDAVRNSRELETSKYERSWIVQLVSGDAMYLVALRAFHTHLSRLNVQITPLADPGLGLSGALRAWITHRWQEAVVEVAKPTEKSWPELTKEMKAHWTDEEWYKQLSATQQTWYDRLRPLKEQWEAKETTDKTIAEAWIVSAATIRTWRQTFEEMKLPGMDWHRPEKTRT